MLIDNEVSTADIDSLTKKLTEFASTLSAKEANALAGVLELAGKMYEGTKPPVTKKKLPLTRETIRELHLWDRLLETQGHSLWTCDRPQIPGGDVINPNK